MKYVIGAKGWSVQVGDGELFLAPGTRVDDTLFPYQLLVNRGPPIDALPIDQATYQRMTSTGGVVGLGYPVWRVDNRLVPVVIPVATHFSVVAPSNTTQGTSFNVTVTALDATGAVVPSFAGHVHFSSSDGSAVLPPDSLLTLGVGTFPVTLNTTGNQNITVTDMPSTGASGTSGSIAVAWAPPQVASTNPTFYADFTSTNHYWASGAQQASYAAWKTAISASFSRSSTATYINSGVVTTAAANVERFPAGNGIRLTGAATNQLLWSQDFTNALWNKFTGSTITGNALAAPDGTTTAGFYVPGNTSGNQLCSQTTIATSANALVTVQGFFKVEAYTKANLCIFDNIVGFASAIVDLSTGTVTVGTSGNGGAQAGQTPTAQATALSNGWWLFSLTLNMGATTTTYNAYFGAVNATTFASGLPTQWAGNGTSGIYVWGMQGTQTAFPCDYIPTTTATVTQAADALSFPYTQTTFSELLIVNGQAWNSVSSVCLTGTNASGLLYILNSAPTSWSLSNGSTLLSCPGITAVGAVNKAMFAGSPSGRSVTANGVTPASDANALTPTPATMALGATAAGSSPSYGNFGQVGIWNGLVASTADMQRLTT